MFGFKDIKDRSYHQMLHPCGKKQHNSFLLINLARQFSVHIKNQQPFREFSRCSINCPIYTGYSVCLYTVCLLNHLLYKIARIQQSAECA